MRAQSAAAMAAAAAALLLLPLLLLPAAIFALPCISKKKHALIIFNVSKRRHIYIYVYYIYIYVSLYVNSENNNFMRVDFWFEKALQMEHNEFCFYA